MPLFSGIYPQVAKNSGRNYLPPVLPAAALPFPVCWGGHGAEKSLSLLWPYWKMGGWRLLKLSLHQRHHTCLAYLHPGQSQRCQGRSMLVQKTFAAWRDSLCPHHISALAFQRPINASNVVTVAHQVRTYTLEAAGFTDSVDVLYMAQIMEKFMEYVTQIKEVRAL